MRRLLLLLLLCTGCSNLLGFSDPQLTDAGGGDDDGSTDGPGPDAPMNTVVGRAFNNLTTAAGGTVEVPIDLTAAIISALIPDSNEPSGYRTAPGSGDAQGNFIINNVPDGQVYLLKVGRAYFVTSAHVIDQHFDMPTRSMPATASGPTPVTFTLGNMQPFMQGPENVGDQFDIFSFAVAYQGFGSAEHGVIEFRGDYDWRDGFGVVFGGAPLPANDDLHVFHTRNEDKFVGLRRIQTQRVVDWFDGGNTTVPDATGSAISGNFIPTPNNRSIMINYARGNFDSAYPGTAEIFPSILVFAHPVATDFAFGVTLAGVYMNDWSHSTATSVFMTLDYADPLPASWQRALWEDYQIFRWILLPGTTTPRPIFGGTQRLRLLPSAAPVLTPVLQPPSMIRLEGVDVVNGGKVAFDGTAPLTMTWSAVATSELYQVTVFRVFANGSQTRTQVAATLTTTATSLEIPAEVFSGGEFFSFTVASVQTPADYAAGAVILNGIPNSFARVPTGIVRLSSVCGNSAIDTGEQCDTGGDSMTCDVDCSTRVCGDGYRNSAAGELCDTVRDTISCDSDCTFPVCGDGYVNPWVEDCDDGNATDENNGCSTLCKFNNQCGDGTHEMLAEECDTGGESVNCDSDCTIAFCGDGHLNVIALEQCDLGGANGGPQCDSACRIP